MNDDDPIRIYVAEFARRLSDCGLVGRRVLEEVECHLRELADTLYRRGLEPAAAAREAIERFGSPDEVLCEFALQAPLESEVMVMIRRVLKPVAWVTLTMAAFYLVMSCFDAAPLSVFVMKAVLSAAVIGCGVTALRQLSATQPMSAWQRGVVLAAALSALVIGSAGAVWTFHLALTTGDWEYYGFAANGLLMLLGAVSATELVTSATRGDSITS